MEFFYEFHTLFTPPRSRKYHRLVTGEYFMVYSPGFVYYLYTDAE